MSFFNELKRRNVFRAGIAYVVAAWLVLQVADVILPNLGAPDWVFRIILLLLVIGFPIALAISWVYEFTTEGVKRETEIEGATPRGVSRQLDFVIIAMLAVALGYFVYDKFVLSAPKSENAIAVLPLKNWTGDPSQEYFADGISEELLILLSKIPALRVIARSSSFAYKGENKKISDIASELNVDHVLEGSVRGFSDAEVRITVQLVRASDESQIWSEAYDRKLSNIFEIQDEIATSVVDQLRLKLLDAIPKAQQADPVAYTAFLRARELGPAHEADLERSIGLYRQALEIDPDYAAAWSGLAENYVYLAEKARVASLRSVVDSPDCTADGGPEQGGACVSAGFEEARAAANNALRFDPENASALASLGRIAMVHEGNLAVAAKHLERALELAPSNPQILRQVAILSGNLHRVDEAVALLEYAVARDPISPAVHNNLALNYYYARQWDKAVTTYRNVLKLSSNPVGVHSWIGLALVFDGEPEAGLVEVKKERHPDPEQDHGERRPWRLLAETMVYHALDRPSDSDNSLNRFIDDYGEEWGFSVATAYAFRGEADRAFEWLDRAKANNDSGLSEIASEPAFDRIKSDPRWLPFLEGVGMAPSQLAAIEFNVRGFVQARAD